MITMLQDKVLVKEAVKQDTRGSGIIIVSDTDDTSPLIGEVVAVGPGKKLGKKKVKASQLKPGDKIMFQKSASQEIKVDGEKLLVLNEDHVLGIVAIS